MCQRRGLLRLLCLLSRLAEARGRLQAEYEQRCSEYAAAKGGLAQRTQQRQEEVRGIVEASVAMPEGECPQLFPVWGV
jgi:hypothetical protein